MKSNIVLRPYQEDCHEKTVWAMNKFDDNSLVVVGQGGGKGIIIASIADSYNSPSLILSPSREITSQTYSKMLNYVDEDQLGIFSASFNKKEHDRKYTLATIQSVYKHPELFEHVEVLFVDEADMWNYKNTSGMFNKFLKALPNKPKIVGFTGTPYRNDINVRKLPKGGYHSQTVLKLINRTYPKIWDRIVYNINNYELTDMGYLTPIDYENRVVVPFTKIPTNAGRSDFNLEAFEKLLLPFEKEILEDINEKANERMSVLVFCASVGQAARMSESVYNSAWVAGDTPTKERDQIVNDFKAGKIKTLFNYSAMAVGFDSPITDTIYLLRPTKSIRWYGQVLGRCTRLSEGKKRSLVVDYSDTFSDLGKLEDIIFRRDESNKWELFANGIPRHNQVLFNYVVDENNKPKKQIKLGGKSI